MDSRAVPQGMHKREIRFPNGNRAQAIFLSANSRTGDLLHALDVEWPNAVIIITGGASRMREQVHPDLVRLFSGGIAKAASSARALIIDGGTQVGVMEIVGQAIAEQPRRLRVIGVAPAGRVSYPGQSTGTSVIEGVPLDPNHSHFVLVAHDEWGSETDTMYDLAKMLSAGCPSVAVLIDGGSFAKSEALHNVRQKRPIIVIEGSGRLANEIARLWQEKATSIADPQLAEIVSQGDIHVFPITGSATELEQLTKRLLSE